MLGTDLGTVSDPDGGYRLPGLPTGSYDLSFSMLGYAPELRKGIAVPSEGSVRLDIGLHPTALEMPALIVSASKRPRSFVDAPTSVSLIGSEELEAHNAISLDESLDAVPGVHMVGGQVNVRGSSGYSRGTGSRVLLLLDGFPALSADNGEVKWDAIPIDQIQRVEIIKGAGSALYGTGALGGIINVITVDPPVAPETRYRLVAGLHSDPAYPEWRWASSRRAFQTCDVSHGRRVGRAGFIAGLGQKWSNGYRQNGWYRRLKGFGKLRFELSPTAKITGTVNWARDDHGVFIQWKDRNEPLEVPAQNLGDRTLSHKLNLNLSHYRLISPRAGCRIKAFVYRTSFVNQVEGAQSSEAYKFGQEVQVDLQPSDPLSLTLGAEWIGDRTRSSPTMFGNHSGLNLAAYAQTELEAGDRATVSAGVRYDRHRTDSQPGAHRVSPKLGLTFHAGPSTVLRAALGWGFRGPSIAEIYTNATFAGVPIAPNPDLEAERSLSCEIGIGHRIGGLARLSATGFWSRYRDLIEARPDASGIVSFRNVSRGTISGVEASLEASWRRFGINGSYTHLRATEDLPTGNAPLPYRPRHVAAGGLQADLGRLTVESRITFRSRTDRSSGLFPEGARDLIAVYLVDISIRLPLGPVNLTLTTHNALEYNYAEVERNLGPPRRFALGLSGKL